MTVSFVGSASAEATSVTLPAHQAGDLLILFVLRNGSTTPITPPTGWMVAGTATFGAATASLQTVFKIATSAAEASGTWTGASLLGCVVYRDDANYITLTAPSGSRNAVVSTAVTFAQKASWTSTTIPGSVSDRMFRATDWVGAIAATTSGTVTTGGAPSGMTARLTATGASTNGLYSFDTNAAVATFAQTTTTAASSIAWATHTFEILDTGIAKAAAASFRPVNIRGGADQ